MPPVRSARASKACPGSGCLRCATLTQPCSLDPEQTSPNCRSSPSTHCRSEHTQNTSTVASEVNQRSAVDESHKHRIARLERTVESLVDRLDAKIDALASRFNEETPPRRTEQGIIEHEPAPVLLIREAALDAGVRSPEQNDARPEVYADPISSGLVSSSIAHSLVELFHTHYGRWVKFPEDLSTPALLSRIGGSSLLTCSVLLIAVRHTTPDLADRLAPQLFREAKRLVTSSLLMVPQTTPFFQAVLILSLWSTTIGQVPLSVDSWLLTGYALQQALISPDLVEVMRPDAALPTVQKHVDACTSFPLSLSQSYLTDVSLRYCVGTRRQAQLTDVDIQRCARLMQMDSITNYEARMIAEVKLYWIIYRKCCGSHPDLEAVKRALANWQQEFLVLFAQPRSQFLRMGFHFAHLLAYSNRLKSSSQESLDNMASSSSSSSASLVAGMLSHAKNIIDLAIDTTDDRTRHLTDQIYHLVTFAALTLCRLVHTYEENLRATGHDLDALDGLVVQLVDWLRSIGLPTSHAAYMLGDIVFARFAKLRPHSRVLASITARRGGGEEKEDADLAQPLLDDRLFSDDVLALAYPGFIGLELFDMGLGGAEVSWPQWEGELYSST
ncbi:uncharacterized protein BO72DRAFT_490589 [Aspergillus fijiensis CBS 313.89]|uniref:Transcription factor domain-containing protein n=1 Tax=Aspergillus fijiensis CBS 313.89 TaxID=1448319 RepID=A0A8G1VSS9_9EURO|nr:uncharacterized protein BO72DRAFT_490589 [Aspergillus fijiensis CBS 313.89]RAK71342.1 hypothetical protein BO72DRAFT_490589 [Aspergillus fijiensis CBS 313.89]